MELPQSDNNITAVFSPEWAIREAEQGSSHNIFYGPNLAFSSWRDYTYTQSKGYLTGLETFLLLQPQGGVLTSI
jgi:hypothetical protein